MGIGLFAASALLLLICIVNMIDYWRTCRWVADYNAKLPSIFGRRVVTNEVKVRFWISVLVAVVCFGVIVQYLFG